MFDSSLESSAFFSAQLHLMRVFSRMVRETGKSLRDLHKECANMMDASASFEGDADPKGSVTKNWEKLLAHHEDTERKLLWKIAEISEDAKGLRDGVSASPQNTIFLPTAFF